MAAQQQQPNDVLDFLDSLDAIAVPSTTVAPAAAAGVPSPANMAVNPFMAAATPPSQASPVMGNPFLAPTTTGTSAPITAPPMMAMSPGLAGPTTAATLVSATSSTVPAGTAGATAVPITTAPTSTPSASVPSDVPIAVSSPIKPTTTTSGGGGWGSWLSSVLPVDPAATAAASALMSKATAAATKAAAAARAESTVVRAALVSAGTAAAATAVQARDRAVSAAGQTTAAVTAAGGGGAVAVAAAAGGGAVDAGGKLFGALSHGVSTVLDAVANAATDGAGGDKPVAADLVVRGLCSVDPADVARDAAAVLRAVFAARGMALTVGVVDFNGVRTYVDEELVGMSADHAAGLVAKAPADASENTIHIQIHPAHPFPTARPNIMTYIVAVHGGAPAAPPTAAASETTASTTAPGPVAVTSSQSFHTAGPHADRDWTRMVLRACLRTSADDWLADLLAADADPTTTTGQAEEAAPGSLRAAMVSRSRASQRDGEVVSAHASAADPERVEAEEEKKREIAMSMAMA